MPEYGWEDDEGISPRSGGGSEQVDQSAGDRPEGRGPGLLLVVILGVLALVMPVLWGIGLIATLGESLGGAALVGLWVAWGVVLVLFVWSLWGMWRGAA